ncbi:MAG: hypothetical protein ABIR58_04630 [Gemmatimonadaceae bacterium]
MIGRRAFALAAALAAIVIVTVLVTGVLFAAGQETRSTRYAILDQQSLSYAERAAARGIESLNIGALDNAAVGFVSIYKPPPDDLFESTVFITKLDSALYLVTGEAAVVAADANRLRRRVGILVTSTRDSSGIESAVRVRDHAWSVLY